MGIPSRESIFRWFRDPRANGADLFVFGTPGPMGPIFFLNNGSGLSKQFPNIGIWKRSDSFPRVLSTRRFS